jgi:AAA domain
MLAGGEQLDLDVALLLRLHGFPDCTTRRRRRQGTGRVTVADEELKELMRRIPAERGIDRLAESELGYDVTAPFRESSNGHHPVAEQDWTGEEPALPPAVPRVRFVRGDEFLEADYPAPVTIFGDERDRLIVQGSLTLVYGDGGAGKSTFTVDAIAHFAAGLPWLGITVPGPVRILVIENESGQGLFQQKLAEKVASWGKGVDWLRNIYVYAEPWGAFSFANEETCAALREFCTGEAIDLVVVNPLFGVGGPGAGKPEETSAFIERLKACGLWSVPPLGFWLIHHENKSGQVSGDWLRHPDTVIELEQDGDQPRTKLSWVKTRWATTPSETRPKKQLLGWLTEHKGYEVLDASLGGNTVSDADLQARLDEFLSSHPRSSTQAVYNGVTGDNARLKRLLEAGAGARTHVVEPGSHGAKLWSVASDAETSSLLDEAATSDEVGAIAHG